MLFIVQLLDMRKKMRPVWAQSAIVNTAAGCGFDSHSRKYLIFPLSSLWCLSKAGR